MFSGKAGPAVNVSLIDLGNRFRMIVNTVDTQAPPQSLPKLPVAHALWTPQPNLETAAAAWIHAGGAHHTVYSQAVSVEMLADYAEMAGIEMVLIDNQTSLYPFKSALKTNSVYYRLSSGI
ncbi:L-arabinose isomerase, partial [Vibrio anguillarum]